MLWDGHDILSRVPDGADWQALGEVFVPRFVEAFERRAPTEHQRFSRIPVLARGPEHGIFQIWTGLLVRTRPDWSILVRQLANYPRHSDYEALEALIETDWWFGPVICLLRMTKTDRVVEFRTARPIIQIQPVYRSAYTKQFTTWRVVTGVESLSTDDWGRLADTLSLRNNEKEAIGSYKRMVRTRQRQRAHLDDTVRLDDRS